MRCSQCGHVNPDDARFCSQCGTPLAVTCPTCGHPAEPDAKFCSNCGSALTPDQPMAPADDLSRYVPETLLHKIRTARAHGSMRGERRTVTMLFADIEGSTAAAERLDPEEWAEVVNGAFEHLIAPVYRYEGTLARLQGDAILAFFGAPIAHEDDPVRAVYAGLEMLDAIQWYADDVGSRTGVPITIRVGINTGLVVVGEVGSDLRVEYTALGDAINVAARMEQTAEPGTVRITEHTAGLLDDAFALTPIGAVEVKGRSDPVIAYRVDGIAADTEPASTAPTPLLGRDQERAALRSVTERLMDGVGGVVTIVGEAGIGKSRLLASARDEVKAAVGVATSSESDGDLAWLEGHSRSFDAAVPYAAFLDLAGRWLDLPDLGDEVAFSRIEAAVERALGEPNDDMTAFLANVAGAPLPSAAASLVEAMETPVLHERSTEAIVTYLEAEAARRPLVLVLDDLHWADPLSLGLAERLLASVDRAPIGLVLALRPVRDEPAWRLVEQASRETAHRHTAIELTPLDQDAAESLVDQLLDTRALGPEDRRRILDRADGNPLFVEELVRSVSADGASTVPTSLAGMLGARLDRLEEDSRLVAEVAAVAGQEFDADDVAVLVEDVEVDAVLAELVREGVLTEQRRLPRPRYAFRHALIQEAAYSTVLLRDRRSLHGRLASHLEQTGAEHPYEIARHHLASDTPTRAFPWLVEAGVRATRAMSLSEAIRLFTTALDHAPPDADPDDVARAHLGLGEAYSLIPDLDQASAALQSLADLGRSTGRPSLEASALNRLGFNAAAIGGDFDAASSYLDSARAVAEAAGDELGLAEYHMNSCFVASFQGDLDRAIAHDEETARIGEVAGSEQVRVTGLVRRATNLIIAAEFDHVEEALRAAREAAQQIGSDELLALLDGEGEGVLRERDGELAASLEVMTKAVDTLNRHGSFYTVLVQMRAASVALRLGRIETALGLLADAVRAAERQGQSFAISCGAANLALCYALLGDTESSAHHRARALEALALPLGDFLASTVWSDLGFVNLEQGDVNAAAADFEVGLQTSSGARFWERPRLLAGAARAALELGRPDQARELVDQGVAYVEERGLRVFAPLLAQTSALLERAFGELAAAEATLARADADADQMGMRLLGCDIAALRAELATEQGRDADAEEHRARREQLVDEITAEITDPELRDRMIARLRQAGVSPRRTSG